MGESKKEFASMMSYERSHPFPRDPLTKLICLKNLFDAYSVTTIGNIHRDEVFSKKAFREVLGINLENGDIEKIKAVLNTRQTGLSVPISVGARYLSLNVGEEELSLAAASLGLGVGVVSRPESTGFVGGGGISAELSLGPIADPDGSGEGTEDRLYVVDVAAWGQLGWNVGPLDLTLQPLFGVSHAIAGDTAQTDVLIGGNAVLSFFGGGLGLVVQGRGMPLHGGYSVGGALQLDLPSLLRDP